MLVKDLASWPTSSVRSTSISNIAVLKRGEVCPVWPVWPMPCLACLANALFGLFGQSFIATAPDAEDVFNC